MLIYDYILMFPNFIDSNYRVYPIYVDSTGVIPSETVSYLISVDVLVCENAYGDSRVKEDFKLMRLVLKC